MRKLYYGDNLQVLRKYIRDETVDLCHIDPPFQSQKTYNQIYKFSLGNSIFCHTNPTKKIQKKKIERKK